jgi:alkylation response protein AidB-like acyl-CoA dehydrogenase
MTTVLADEHRAYRDVVERFVAAEMPKEWARKLEAREEDYPFELWDKFTAGGFHGLGIAEEYGGVGGDIFMQVIAARALSRTLAGLAWLWGINAFAGAKALTQHGTPEQKARFLPDIAAGKLRAAISLTEPGGGTDVLGAMKTIGRQVDGGWRISGEKIWSSQSHVADYLLLLARTDLKASKHHHGLTLFWVPARSAGITITPLKKMGMRAMGSCSVHLDDVFVADELVLGERTVETHVSSILARLGATSRREIATWVAEVGLAAGDA